MSIIDERFRFFAARCCASAAYAVMRCPSVCPSVRLSRSWILSKRISISSIFFSPSSSQTILVFPYQTSLQYSDGIPLTGASNGVGVGTNRDSEPILLNLGGGRLISISHTVTVRFLLKCEFESYFWCRESGLAVQAKCTAGNSTHTKSTQLRAEIQAEVTG